MSSKRNESILAHGTVAVTKQKFDEMQTTLHHLIPDFPSAEPTRILPPPFKEAWLNP
jgi:hypothetical protein